MSDIKSLLEEQTKLKNKLLEIEKLIQNKKIYIVREISSNGCDLNCEIIGCYKSYDIAREKFVIKLTQIKQSYLSLDDDVEDDFLINYHMNKFEYELNYINKCIED